MSPKISWALMVKSVLLTAVKVKGLPSLLMVKAFCTPSKAIIGELCDIVIIIDNNRLL